MATSSKEVQVLQKLFRSLTAEGSPHRLTSGITDLFIRINGESGEVSLYGDDDELITSTVIFSWVGQGDKSLGQRAKALRSAITALEGEGFWEHEVFERPFSVVLVSEEFTSEEELLFLDDDLLQLTTPLLAGLDAELGEFIDELLKR